MLCTDTTTIEFFKAFATPIAASIVGIAAIFVSLKQAKIAEAKVRYDMYKDRNEVFQRIWEFLSHPMQDYEKNHPKFTNLIPEAKFLFGSDVAELMSEASKKAVRLMLLNNKQNREGMTNDEIHESTDLHKWFFDKASNAKEFFAPHFDFSTSINPFR
jgi:hypothetical protein